MEPPQICLNSALFVLKGTLHKQTNGVDKGSHVPLIVAYLLMSHTEFHCRSLSAVCVNDFGFTLVEREWCDFPAYVKIIHRS